MRPHWTRASPGDSSIVVIIIIARDRHQRSSGIDVDIKNCEGKGDLVDRSIPTIVGATVACPSIGRTTDNEFRVSIASTTTSPVGSA